MPNDNTRLNGAVKSPRTKLTCLFRLLRARFPSEYVTRIWCVLVALWMNDKTGTVGPVSERWVGGVHRFPLSVLPTGHHVSVFIVPLRKASVAQVFRRQHFILDNQISNGSIHWILKQDYFVPRPAMTVYDESGPSPTGRQAKSAGSNPAFQIFAR